MREKLKKLLLERCDSRDTAINNLDLLEPNKYEAMINYLSDNPDADDGDINIEVYHLMRDKWDNNLEYLRSEIRRLKALN